MAAGARAEEVEEDPLRPLEPEVAAEAPVAVADESLASLESVADESLLSEAGEPELLAPVAMALDASLEEPLTAALPAAAEVG